MPEFAARINKQDTVSGFRPLLPLCPLFLLLVAAGMVAIALLDSTPNIINYENKIQDKYAQWEMDLEEREAKVKEKERELHLE